MVDDEVPGPAKVKANGAVEVLGDGVGFIMLAAVLFYIYYAGASFIYFYDLFMSQSECERPAHSIHLRASDGSI